MTRPSAFPALLILALSPFSAVRAADTGFLERFALAADRDAVLKELVPGTDDYYYFHALHRQVQKQLPELDAILTEWEGRFPGANARRDVIRTRRALLGYESGAEATLTFLKNTLKLSFDHQQDTAEARADLPSTLDQALLTPAVFEQKAWEGTVQLENITDPGLFALGAVPRQWKLSELRAFLGRIRRPDHPGVLQAIDTELKEKDSVFGNFPIHHLLTADQLAALVKLHPRLATDAKYVAAVMNRMRPSDMEDPERDPAVRQAWLERLWAYASTLPESFNSLKANLLYHLLALDESRGRFDEARLLAYLKLPRPVAYINPRYRENREVWKEPADLNFDPSPFTGTPPVSNEEPLLRRLLLQYFTKTEDLSAVAPYVAGPWLRAVLAEARLVSGAPDAPRWVSMLPPATYEALRERTDIDFDAAAPKQFSVDDAVKIDVWIKNVPSLLVRVYEINTANVHRTTGQQISTALDLDGLTANLEQNLTYSTAPLIRHRETFSFPDLSAKRGVWIVEFVGGGKASRAVIQKGNLRPVVRQTSAGTTVTVLNEKLQPLPDAFAMVGPKRFEAGETGLILLPLSTTPGPQKVILDDGTGFTALQDIDLQGESYTLEAGFHVPRESLLPGSTATVTIRPRLLSNGRAVLRESLKEVTVTIASTTLDGTPASVVVPVTDFAGQKELTAEFAVPDRLQSLSFTLTGKVDSLVTVQPVPVSVSRSLEVNGVTRAGIVADLHLSRDGVNWVLQELGLNGEPRPGRSLNLSLRRPAYLTPVAVSLKTSSAGSVSLGPLEGIDSLTVTGSGGMTRVFTLPQPRYTVPEVLHLRAGESLQVPWTGPVPPPAGHAALFEERSGFFVRQLPSPAPNTAGYMEWKELPPGSYALFSGQQKIQVRISDGTAVDGHLLTPSSTLQITDNRPLSVTGMLEAETPLPENKGTEKTLVFHIGNASAETRVHVFASRFLPEFDAWPDLTTGSLPWPSATRPAWFATAWLSARDIGDEYRYVLERRGAPRFAGNLLSRPGLLLNPWEIADTRTRLEDLTRGDRPRDETRAGRTKDFDSRADPKPGASDAPQGIAPVPGSDLSFLAKPGLLAANLKPDAAGNVTIRRSLLADRNYLRVLAVHETSSAMRDFALPAVSPELRDLRLAKPLDPAQHYSRQNQVTLLEKDKPFRFDDALAAQFQAIGNLGTVHQLFLNLTMDPLLTEFSWLLEWPALEEKRKRELYSQYACHELHFFLAQKDPAFFEAVIRPYLASKRDKTFMDEYLTGADLSRHVEPWHYAGLNAPERLLLARRLAAELPAARRQAEDWMNVQPVDRNRDLFLFETALRGRTLMAGGAVVTAGAGWKNSEGGALFGAANGPTVWSGQPGAVRFRGFGNGMEEADGEARGLNHFYGYNARDHTRLKMVNGVDQLGTTAVPSEKAENAQRLLSDQLTATYKAHADDFIQPAEPATAEGLVSERQVLSRYAEARKQNEEIGKLFRQADPTKVWAEQNYYKLPVEQQIASLVPMSRFWRDYALWDGKSPFISTHLPDAAGSFSGMILALAVLDLPFPGDVKPGEATTKDNVLTLTPAQPAVLFHQEIRTAEPDTAGVPLLVSQNFFREGDRYIEQAGEKTDKFVTREFLTGTVYGCQVVVTNPSSSRQRLDVLFQIPAGSLPVQATRRVQSVPVQLEPWHTTTLDFHFYFPAPGKFAHYPVHISRDAKTAAFAAPFEFNVTGQPSINDPASWDYISQHGTGTEVLTFLEQHNLYFLNLDRILWRLKDADFFRRVIAHLKSRHVFHAGVWSYAVLHDTAPYLTEYLMETGLPAQCGPAFECALLTVDPVEQKTYQHLEYSPLINARAHALGGKHAILNDRFRAQWDSLMTVLSSRPKNSAEDLLAVTGYLALQDRMEEAVETFDKVDRAAIAEKVQYEYLRAWLAMCQEDTATARRIATALAAHPVDHWRKKFAALTSQLDEIEGKPGAAPAQNDREAGHDALAGTDPSIALTVENKTVALKYRNLTEVTVSYFPIDLEFLFSSNPFVGSDAGRFGVIRPKFSERLMLPAGGDTHIVALPAAFQQANVLIEVSGAGVSKTAAVYAHALDVQFSESFGQLTVHHQGDRRPLPKTYVKVFADRNGIPEFYKDGYTDLRGKFDYASLSTPDLDSTRRFSILIMSEEHGALVKEVQPPAR